MGTPTSCFPDRRTQSVRPGLGTPFPSRSALERVVRLTFSALSGHLSLCPWTIDHHIMPGGSRSCRLARPRLFRCCTCAGCFLGLAEQRGDSERGPGPSLPAGMPPAADVWRRGRVGPLYFHILRARGDRSPWRLHRHLPRGCPREALVGTVPTFTQASKNLYAAVFASTLRQVTYCTSRSRGGGPPLTTSSTLG